ncbi:hypothetical protein E2C01_027470 [Portunus trituberculatus]|uniref:Uncharacterized protein n=1 Tax=Portunus trituberculatus TaxID=210409 RepID=A0A5B7EIT3_PORTR|nr:hypothetical protein [Portunus trituberculatus]
MRNLPASQPAIQESAARAGDIVTSWGQGDVTSQLHLIPCYRKGKKHRPLSTTHRLPDTNNA